MASPPWLVDLLKKNFAKRFFIARLTRAPLVGRLLRYLLFETDEVFFLPKDRVISVNAQVETPTQMVLPSQIVEHFIEEASFCWVMNFCICRTASQCKDYPRELGCLFLGEAARGINPRFGHPVSKTEALAHVQRCREAGLVHLIGRNKLDTLWLGVGPGDRLLTVCNCCPCCCLQKMLPFLAPQAGAKFAKLPGVSVTVDQSRCAGCGTCASGYCFVDAIHVVGHKAVISQECRGCGRCVEACPRGAIKFSIEPAKSVAAVIKRITQAVNVH